MKIDQNFLAAFLFGAWCMWLWMIFRRQQDTGGDNEPKTQEWPKLVKSA